MSDLLDDPRNPAALTPSERRLEIAAILAKGVLRLRQCRRISPPNAESRTPEKGSKSSPTGLDESARTSPHGVTG